MRSYTITKENARFQILNALKTNRQKRNREGFLVEGVRGITSAYEHSWPITSFIFSSQRGVSDWAAGILKRSDVQTRFDLSPELLAKLSNKEEPSELIACVDIPADDLSRITPDPRLLVVVLDRPARPGNLGTIIRTCDALGVAGVVVTGHAADVYDPETVSASVGSLFSLPVVRVPSQTELMPWIGDLRSALPDLCLVGMDESGSRSVFEHDLRKPTVLLVGNEKAGLSSGYREVADELVAIPMKGSASSLNVAVATSIALAEAGRQRAE